MKKKMTKMENKIMAMQMQKIKKTSTDTKNATNEIKDENKNMLLEYMGNVDDKLFKEYSHGKKFNSFINEFGRATNEHAIDYFLDEHSKK